jgi:hypothetical protein
MQELERNPTSLSRFGIAVGKFLLPAASGNVSLTLLGPGAWSLDALLYGRKRIRFDEN